MIKYLFILINSLSFLFFGLLDGDNGVSITHTIPATLTAGKEVVVELKINKGGMGGFAKLQMELPEGITAVGNEEKGATYSANESMVKWVWAALPSEEEIVVTVTLTPSTNTNGPKTITAKYSFVENNVKKVVEMTPMEVNVVAPGSEPIASETPSTPDSTTPSEPEPAKPELTGGPGNEPPGNVTASRNVGAGSSFNEFIVTVTIKKDGTKGFARYSDDILDGLTAKAIKTDGASFSVADGKIKFVWVNVPEKDELEVVYSLSGNLTTAVTLYGEYSYLEDNQSKKIKMEPESIAFQKQMKPDGEPVATQTPDPGDNQPVKNNELPKTDGTVEKKEGSLNYRVQIGAFTKASVTDKKLAKKFKIKDKIRSEMAEGYTKFMIGSFDEYRNARDKREVAKYSNGVKSAFVVAYNEGKRITVQEALMISTQKWYK